MFYSDCKLNGLFFWGNPNGMHNVDMIVTLWIKMGCIISATARLVFLEKKVKGAPISLGFLNF